jgi:hypothetical protein
LSDNGAPANGVYDLRFTLHESVAGGAMVGGPLTNRLVPVTGGLFVAALDFGDAPYTGADRWLEIGVRTNGGGAFIPLSPRQFLGATPYAIRARTAASVPAGVITSSMLAGGAVTAAKLAPGAVSQLGTPDGSNPRAVQVNNAGLVGMGTTNPVSRLELVRDWDGQEGALRLSGDKPTIKFAGRAVAGNVNWLIHQGSDGPGSLQFYRQSSAPGAPFLHTLTLSPAGRVGIGTPHPAYPLSVDGSAAISGLLFVTNGVVLGGNPQSYHATGGEERLRIIRGVVVPSVISITNPPAIIAGLGFTAVTEENGRHRIRFDTPFAGIPAVTASAKQDFDWQCPAWVWTSELSAGGVVINVECEGGSAYWPFSFIAIGPR